MDDMCTDNRFELIERFKKKLIESTNIETSAEEMKAIDNLLFRFWQMGWLDIIDRMLLVKESAKTLMHSVGNSVSAKAFRNAGRFIQNAIDGEAPEFEKIPPAQPEIIRRKDCKYRDENWRRVSVRWLPCMDVRTGSNWYCGSAERRTDSMAEINVPIQVNLPDDWIEQIVNRLRNDPEAEWVEIVRCKNCKHRNKDGECGQYDDGTVAVSCEVPDDHYCGYAERRTDDLQ